jgi:hypothetical protein
MQGRANAAVGSVTGTAQSVSIALGAALITVIGFQAMYLIMAATAVLCAASVLVGRVPQPDVVKSVADTEEIEDDVNSTVPAPEISR